MANLSDWTPLITAAVAGVFGYASGRGEKKSEAAKNISETDKNIIQNLQSSIGIYKGLLDDLSTRYNRETKELKERILALENEIKEIKKRHDWN